MNVKAKTQGPLKLAAIDLDGTLLSPDLTISPENSSALRALQKRGIEIVIATGRHHISTAPFAALVPGVHWIISAQGGEISSHDRSVVLGRNFMPPPQVALALDQAQRLGLSVIIYGPDRVFTHGPENEAVAFYQKLSGLTPVASTREETSKIPTFKIVAIGTPDQVAAIMANAVANPAFEMVQTHHRIVEFMPPEVTKASGLKILTKHLGISAPEVVAFGDSGNDIPMFQWAGYSVAMAHGLPAALKAANIIAPTGPPETALARAINTLLESFPVNECPTQSSGVRPSSNLVMV